MGPRLAWLLLLIPALACADDDALTGVGTAEVPIGYVNVKDPWIDRLHQGVFNSVWRSAMRVDQWFGSTADENAYMQTSGSIAPRSEEHTSELQSRLHLVCRLLLEK